MRSLAALIETASPFQRLGRLHHKGLVVPTHAVGGVDGGSRLQRASVSGVLAMVLIDRCRHRPSTEGVRGSLPIPDAPRLCGMLGSESGSSHHAGRMPVVFRPERCRNILRHIHATAALVV